MADTSDWIVRLETRLNDHIHIERQEWDKMHREIAVLQTQVDSYKDDLKELKKVLGEVRDEIAEFRGAKKAIFIVMTLVGITSSAATAFISYLTLKAP